MPKLYSGQGIILASLPPLLSFLNRYLPFWKRSHGAHHFNVPNIVFAIRRFVSGTTIASLNQAAPVRLSERDNSGQPFKVRFESVLVDTELYGRIRGKNKS